MPEYIEREALKNKKVYCEERHEYVVPVSEIDWQPTADVVEVVRCKDCKHWKNRKDVAGNIICSVVCMKIHTESYCSYGERMIDNA